MTDIVIPDIPPVPVVAPYPALGAPNFNQMAYAVGIGMPGVVSGLNAIALAARQCALAARADALAVAAYVGVAQGAAGTATAKAGEAAMSAAASDAAKGASIAAAGASIESADASAGSAQESEDARIAAVAAREGAERAQSGTEELKAETKIFRDQAEVYASSQLKGSSSTSIVPGAGAKALAMEPSRSFVAGMYVIASSVSDLGTWMSGRVQSYDMGTGDLVIGVDAYAGAAAKADWVIGVAAPGEHNGMTRQRIAASTVAVPGVVYVIVGADLTLTLPPASAWQDGDPFGVRLGVAVTNKQQIDYGDLTVRGQPGGLRYINRRGYAQDLVFDSLSGGFV